jgi:tryptophanyl-tRNA synthetase
MSKSDETGRGVIFLNDSPEAASKKIMAATTDSLENITYDPVNQPGVSNLLQILALLTSRSLETVIKEYEGQKMYGPLKSAVADAVSVFLIDFQAKFNNVDEESIRAKLETSEALMRKQASETLLRVQKAVGLRA